MVEDPRSWPVGLRRLAEVIGPAAAVRLAEEFGGTANNYIPRRARADHPFTAVIGLDKMERLCAEFGGERLDIPRGVYRHLKKAEILQAEGSARTVARRLGVTMRYVRKVRALTTESAQPDLFSD